MNTGSLTVILAMIKSLLPYNGVSMAISSNLGFPRIGQQRELKKALESFWAGKISEQELLNTARVIRLENWTLQKELGIQHIPSNDFSLYDHVLDTILMLGAIPPRFQNQPDQINLETYFAMARGSERGIYRGIPALEMTKWLNTNYHYLVAEITPETKFQINCNKLMGDFKEALTLNILTKPVLLGPVSFLLLSKSPLDGFSPLEKINELVPAYLQILENLIISGVEWVQMDEPCLVQDLDEKTREVFIQVYSKIGRASQRPKILLADYFFPLGKNLELTLSLPIEAVHLDLISGAIQLESALKIISKDKILSLGIVDGRNVWKTDFQKAFEVIEKAIKELSAEQIILSPSCSLLHVPQDLEQEKRMNSEVKSWLAFGKQKLEEVVLLTALVNQHVKKNPYLEMSRLIVQNKQSSSLVHNRFIKEKISQVIPKMKNRKSDFSTRRKKQQNKYQLPLLPITSIGSFPQTDIVRVARKRYINGEINEIEYEDFIKKEIIHTINFQEEIGMDVLVHGEFERNDMVQYFAEQLEGFAFTENGWVQSFGSRYVRPPIIYGDISRPKPMTVEWAKLAQAQSKKPVKGMLTGPITMLNWSFVRNDQSRSETCRQIALAIREEVNDLEAAGIGIIQIDEPALREGLPLQKENWQNYLNWAVECFRLSTGGVQDETQIHTHMCYSEFNDIIQSIAALDADVISIEATRSHMELLKAFLFFHYPNDIGPGVYDIHSPHIPDQEKIFHLLKEALQVLPANQLWVNPDCGLKTRRWEEIEPALKAMVAATKQLRQEIVNL
jgi:5-methyltetrahydropteroyltriglutamate--homocysteine methyltransferase